ncbi:MAG TPA: septation protein SepH [Acidimicrobiales bacterium]
MQQLHLVGFTTDLDHLILSTRKGAKSGSFLVPLDDRLLEVIGDAVRRRNQEGSHDGALEVPAELVAPREPTRRTSLLSPREIQARLRSGRTIVQVAKDAAADEEWVEKFAPPVLAERERVVDSARELVYGKPRRGPSAETLGMSVRWNLADRGIRFTDDEFDACWSAFHVAEATWGITFEFVSRGKRQRAEWEVDFHDGELAARNRVASDLAYVEPGRRRRPVSLAPPVDTRTPRRDAREAVAADDEPAPRPKRAAARKAASKRSRSRSAAAPKKAPPRSRARAATKRAGRPVTASKASKTSKASKASKTAGRTAKAAKSARATKTAKATKAGKATKRGGSRAGGRGDEPPRPAASSPLTPQDRGVMTPRVVAVPPRNELAKRRMELVRAATTNGGPAPNGTRGRPVTGSRPRPAPPSPPASPPPTPPAATRPSTAPAETAPPPRAAAHEGARAGVVAVGHRSRRRGAPQA